MAFFFAYASGHWDKLFCPILDGGGGICMSLFRIGPIEFACLILTYSFYYIQNYFMLTFLHHQEDAHNYTSSAQLVRHGTEKSHNGWDHDAQGVCVLHKQRIIFQILLKQPEIRLYLPFSD